MRIHLTKEDAMVSIPKIIGVIACSVVLGLSVSNVAAAGDKTMETGTNMKEGGPNLKMNHPVPQISSKQFPEYEGMETGTNMKEGGPNLKMKHPVPQITSKQFPEHEGMETGTNMKEGGPNMKMNRTGK